MKVTIKRDVRNNKLTFGKMFIDNYNDAMPFAQTLEPPDLNNLPMISCIPLGIYKCKRHTSLQFGEVWEIMDVPGRSEVLIHNGNLPIDTHGCVLIGDKRGIASKEITNIDGKKEIIKGDGVLNSKEALHAFMAWTKYETELDLVIELASQFSSAVRS